MASAPPKRNASPPTTCAHSYTHLTAIVIIRPRVKVGANKGISLCFEGNNFINLVAEVDTDLSPINLKRWLFELENRHGRARDVPKFSDRTLDIDILLYDDLYLLSPELEIPREEILEYAHVLKPLADLAPGLLHPVRRKTIAELWDEFREQNPEPALIEL